MTGFPSLIRIPLGWFTGDFWRSMSTLLSRKLDMQSQKAPNWLFTKSINEATPDRIELASGALVIAAPVALHLAQSKSHTLEASDNYLEAMDTSIKLRDDYLRRDIAGHYKTNLALIALSRPYSFWHPANESTLDRWCIFAHEYSHFLHNFSTVSGLHDMIIHLRLTRYFRNTVGTDGNSRGMAALNDEERAEVGKWLRWREHLRGTLRPFDPEYHRTDVQIRINSTWHSRESLNFSTQPHLPLPLEDSYVSFAVWSQTTPKEECEVLFGSWHIMEALAYEIERTIFKANEADVALIDTRTDTYPYKLGRLLFHHLSKQQPAQTVMTRVCLMALQSSDPGAAFIELATEFGKRPAGEPDHVTLKRFEDITLREFRRTFASLTHLTLHPEFNLFGSGTGPVAAALATLSDMSQRYIDLRAKDHFFELNLFEHVLDRAHFHQLLQSYPPCPIVHEADFGHPPEFFNLSLTDLSGKAVEALCAYQAFGQFMQSHLRSDGFVATARCPPRRCIFFGACAAPQATHAPHLCQTKPWSAFDPNDLTGCLYAAAVSAARGRADL